MNILICSDTHCQTSTQLPNSLFQLADRADHIIHAGDFVAMEIADTLRSLAPTTIVKGNCDYEFPPDISEIQKVELNGVAVGIIHDLNGRRSELDDWQLILKHADLIIHGHTHRPKKIVASNGPIIFNPGSVTSPRGGNKPSCGWLQITDGNKIEIEHVFLT